jgi:hypothetical protein
MQKFDYTYKRLGSKDRRGRLIKCCPKCGKRGAYSAPFRGDKTKRVMPATYTHVEEFDGFFTFIRESCWDMNDVTVPGE